MKESNGARVLFSRLRFGGVVHESKPIILKPGPVKLGVKGENSSYTFTYSQADDAMKDVQKVDARFISTETVGGFSGLYVGLYATGQGKANTANADYDWLEYLGDETSKK